MKLFGFEITRQRKQYPMTSYADVGRGGWYPIVRESYTGAWQRNDEHYRHDGVMSNAIVFRCVSLIANDISKMRIRLVRQDANGIWKEVPQEDNSAFWPVLRRPNGYQNRIQFYEQWLTSKLMWGNTYILKRRDQRNVVTELYILEPTRVRPLVAPNGDVFYELSADNLSDLQDRATVPASEIIHDRMNTFYHPLSGLSPIHAAGLAAIQSLRIQSHSERFFGNAANPGGLLIAPGNISKEDAARLKETFQQSFTGANAGRLAVVGNGMKFESLVMTSVDAQLIEQLKWTSETICSAFGVPGYKVGVGPAPTYNNIEALERQYYNDCLQVLIESIELCLDEGLELPKPYGSEFDLDDLLRMDAATMVDSIGKAVGAGVLAPDEGRKRLGYGPVEGGGTPYLQQQNYSLAALNKRDTQADPFAPQQAQQPTAQPEPTSQSAQREFELSREMLVAIAEHRLRANMHDQL